ncbi:hypothetical protein N836_30840 [Leptolyngbya sp. Heron Island J]|uniref:hypothetical protein n=1 Tax=Leptolyngbya sp. Heron Island J TaxID=1385935 RepID=UPI0003B9A35D|nr:hypothetical protein [Leptolyngbya sp. Heron Island J]ESA38717.1 hypothetical protein N836_30840 [Leptolyngbya sp. Heron Island J]
MKEILAFIQAKQHNFSRLPLFSFLRDTGIPPRDRLNFGPSFAVFAMNFKELNSHILYKECSENNEIQRMINQHAREDALHWEWILEDFDKLGFNSESTINDALRLFWGAETKASRQHFYDMVRLIYESEPVFVLVIIEAIEATGNVFFSALTRVAKELQVVTEEDYRYYGKHHLSVETGHAIGTADIENILDSISLTNEEIEKAFILVDKIFSGFSELLNEYHTYAKTHAPARSSIASI